MIIQLADPDCYYDLTIDFTAPVNYNDCVIDTNPNDIGSLVLVVTLPSVVLEFCVPTAAGEEYEASVLERLRDDIIYKTGGQPHE